MPDCVAVPLIVNRFVLLSYVGVSPLGKLPATMLINVALDVDSYTIGVINEFTQTVVVAEPPINVNVELGLIVIVPVVVAVTQIPAVAMVYVKVPDCVAVPLMVNSFVASLYPDVNPAGKPPATILIPLVLDVDL